MNARPDRSRLARIPRSLRVLYAGTIATRLGSFVVPYLTLYLSQDRGLSLSATGRILAAGGVGLLLGNLLGGWAADRLGRKPTLLAALVLNAAGVAMLAVPLPSGLAYALALGAALAGAGMYTPAANALIADRAPDDIRPLAFTIHYVCINVGMGLGPLLGGLLAASSYGWLFVGDVATTMVCAGLIAVGITARPPPATPQAERGALRSTLEVWRAHPRVLAFCGASFFVIAPLMGMEYTVPLFVGRVLGEPLAFVGLVYSINAACILALGFPIERLARGRDEVTMMAIAGALWAGGLSVLLVGASLPALLACTVVWTLGEIVASIVVPTYVSRHVAASAKGRMLALQEAMRSLAGIVAPITLGLVWDARGVEAVLLVLVLTPLLGTLAYLATRLARGWRAAPDVAPEAP